jgi:hypothetical protein
MFPTSRKMTSTAILFLSFLTGCLSQNVAEMGILQLQYYSKSGAVASDILSNSISVTRDFLDAHFADYFDNTVGNGYFSHISLTVVDFDVLNDYAVSIDLKGSAFFQRTPVPGSSFLSTVLYDAFKGDSRMDYVSQLQTADDDFFQLLSYIVIGLDGNVIANEDVAAKSLGRESADALTNGGVEGLAIPEIVIIAGASAAGFALVIISAVLFSFSRDGSKKLTSKGRDLVIDTAITSKESGNTEVNTGSPKWISPLCSAESQDSSVFTYNPRTTTNLKTESKPNPPAFQKNRQDIRMALDAKAWSKASDQQSVGPDQIQNSIFAIDDDKKESCTELSFIEEGDNEDVSLSYRHTTYKCIIAMTNILTSSFFLRIGNPKEACNIYKKEGSRWW